MVSAWGGYAFIINIIPIFVIFLFIIGKLSTRVYVAYSSFYMVGTLYAMQIPFVGF
jgi:dolichyl-diphosphooligosaccharide--protein glycosyltransferase